MHNTKWSSKIAYTLAIFGGAGLSRVAPGSVGTLASFILWGPLLFLQASVITQLVIVVLVTILAIWASDKAAKQLGGGDPQQIVIDEVAGQGVALIGCPHSLLAVGCCFALFRLFDATKPWPICWLDRNVHGGLGIVLDDVAAGLCAAFVLQSLHWAGLFGMT
ncbi:MAG: phosphatidylglycerophosphatase A [Myxococcota bacterium]